MPGQVVWCGDMNVCHLDADIWNVGAKHLAKSAGTTKEERESFANSLAEVLFGSIAVGCAQGGVGRICTWFHASVHPPMYICICCMRLEFPCGWIAVFGGWIVHRPYRRASSSTVFDACMAKTKPGGLPTGVCERATFHGTEVCSHVCVCMLTRTNTCSSLAQMRAMPPCLLCALQLLASRRHSAMIPSAKSNQI